MDINAAAVEVERFLQVYEGRGGRRAVEVRAHPSGDDLQAIKIWVNLGADAEREDLAGWCHDAEAAIRKTVAGLDGFTLELRADAI